jgi:hypothetical protein
MSMNLRLPSFVVALILTVAACASANAPSPPAEPGTGLAITSAAGPTCPVETLGDPACAPRPVPGAKVTILDAGGREVSTVTLDAKGAALVTLPAGKYVIRAQPAAGLMGTPGPMDVAVVEGKMTAVDLSYDTGIR